MDNTNIRFHTKNIKIIKRIGQGAYSYVYSAIDVNDRLMYAVKQISANDDRYRIEISNEIKALKKLTEAPNIIHYYDDVIVGPNQYILLEYCPISMFSCIEKRKNVPFDDKELLKLLFQITKAVDFMHNLKPPLINRDLKVDNILLNQKFFVRLCDFGSATTECINPANLNHNEKILVEEKLKEATTSFYQAPEIIDLYLNHIINEKIDIWALGCIYYFLCSFTYPFEDGARLAILNLNYKKITSSSIMVEYQINPIISRIFTVDPSVRPNAANLIEEFDQLARVNQLSVYGPVFIKQSRSDKKTTIPQNTIDNVLSKAGNLFEILKEKGQKLKNQINQKEPLKEQPKAVLKPPCVYFTSRLAISTCPYSSSAAYKDMNKLSAEVLAEYLISTYPGSFAVLNLINSENYQTSSFLGRVVTFNFSLDKVPNIRQIFNLIIRVQKYMTSNPKHILLLHCTNGGYLTHYIICILIIYTGLFNKFKDLFESVLISNPQIILPITHPSFLRYGSYIERIAKNPSFILLNSPIHLTLITITPVILCNRNKTGCRPFISVHVYGRLIYTSKSDVSCLNEYTLDDQIIEIPLDVTTYGDVKITFHHSMVINGNNFQKTIFSFQFHTAFLQSKDNISLTGPELDIASASTLTALFKTNVKLFYATGFESVFSHADLNKHIVKSVSPMTYFSNAFDLETFIHLHTQNLKTDFTSRRLQNLLDLKDEQSPKLESLVDHTSSHIDQLSRASPIFTANDFIDEISLNSNVSSKQEKIDQDLFDIFQKPYKSSAPSNPFLQDNVSSDIPTNPFDDIFISPQTNISELSHVFSHKSNQDMISFDQKGSSTKFKSSDSLLPLTPINESFPLITDQNLFFDCNSTYIASSSPPMPSTHMNQHIKPANSYNSLKNAFQDIHKPIVSPLTTTPIHSDSAPSYLFKDPFSDIIPDHGFTSNLNYNKNPKPSLDETKRIQEDMNHDSPSRRKVQLWARGKQKNIKALLANLHLILWHPNQWDVVNMKELNNYNSIKKAYRKACLIIHPDKLTDNNYTELANAIFCEISEAWSAFESTGGKVYQ